MNNKPVPVALFRLGRIQTTPSVLASLSEEDILLGIQRHQAGDWGSPSEHDRQANQRALADGGRLVSAYNGKTGVRYWIITEADRSMTTVLLPEDY